MASGDSSNKITVSFEAARCLYTHSTWTNCSLCIDSCPGKAIKKTAEERLPVLDPSLCVHCGQCLSACPLEAFTSSGFTERQLFNRINPEGSVRLRCFLPYGELDSLGANGAVYQLGTCLAALSTGALFELSLSRSCFLVTDTCPSCPLFPFTRSTLGCNVVAASQLVSDWGEKDGLKETVHLFLPEEAPSSERANLAGDAKAHSAAEVRSNPAAEVRLSIRSLFHGRRESNRPRPAVLPLKSKRKHVPAWRHRLRDMWDRRPAAAQSNYPWPLLIVRESRCRACGMCMQLCPTGSIRQVLQEGRFTYEFTPGTCVDCGLCIASCPAVALSRSYRPANQPFEPLECLSQAAKPCVRCGMPVLEKRGGTHCFLCLSEPDPRTLLTRIRQQMGLEPRGNQSEKNCG